MKPSNQITWFVEMQGVTLCSRDRNVRRSIPYPHAGLWALIANGNYNSSRATEMMSILMSVAGPEAEYEVGETLAEWRRAGLLCED